jgi:hypothetical protein
MKVYQAINAVQLALSKEGISKDRTNQKQGYKFRGIDDVYNALSSLLAENSLCILPRMLSHKVTERQSKAGDALFSVIVEAEFDLVSAVDASKHTIKTFGEAMDSGDKATNKAMSAAYKYACMQAFSIPTEGDNDADSTTHEPKFVGLGKPQDGMSLQDFPPAMQMEITAWANDIKKAAEEDDLLRAVKHWKDCDLENEAKTAVWFLLGTQQHGNVKLTTAIKRLIETHKVVTP